MRYAAVDCRMDCECLRSLENYADEIIKLEPHPLLPPPVASHPDMLLWHANGEILIYPDYLNEQLYSLGCKVRAVSSPPAAIYPKDVGLNCAVVGENIIAHTGFACPEILRHASDFSMRLLHTKQGYAKCSTVCVSENAIITSDPSIARTALAADIDTLQIRAGYVSLDGYDTGFIGGASGVTETEILFCGLLDFHPDADKIIEFCRKHGKRAVSLSHAPLYDYGTIFFFGDARTRGREDAGTRGCEGCGDAVAF